MFDFTENDLRVLRTMISLSEKGLNVDQDELIDVLMEDYDWSEDEANQAIENAEQSGHIWMGKPNGSLLS